MRCTAHLSKCVVQILSKWMILYWENKKTLFLPGVTCALSKKVGMTSLYANEVIPMDPPLHTFLVKFGSNFRSKMRRIEKANNNREAACSDGEDLLLGSRVEVDIESA